MILPVSECVVQCGSEALEIHIVKAGTLPQGYHGERAGRLCNFVPHTLDLGLIDYPSRDHLVTLPCL